MMAVWSHAGEKVSEGVQRRALRVKSSAVLFFLISRPSAAFQEFRNCLRELSDGTPSTILSGSSVGQSAHTLSACCIEAL